MIRKILKYLRYRIRGRLMGNKRTFVADFETTVFKGQTFTEVWASACVELYSDDVKIFHSIGEQWDYFKSLNCNLTVYYHNLKFDGSFWLSYLLKDLGFKQGYYSLKKDTFDVRFKNKKDMFNGELIYSISNMGQWYSITVKTNNHYIEFRDSLKLIPFSVKTIGESFGTAHKKLDMEYEGFRYAGCVITPEEQKYIANDVLVVKEALEIMFDDGHNKLTIGSCCMSDYKKSLKGNIRIPLEYDEMFPKMTDIILDKSYGYATAEDYIRASYKGGWCYIVKEKANKLYDKGGITADVNSLYPSMMHSESGNRYPYGLPTFWKGNRIPDEAIGDNKYYFVRVKTRFYIKENMLPFIQIKRSIYYEPNEALETSDVKSPTTGEYYQYYYDKDGNVHDTRVELVLTMTDYQLFLEYYDAVEFEILDGCWFYAMQGMFDDYINAWGEVKRTSKGAKRTEAKLFLNNLYGKFASSTDSSFKVAYLKDDKTIGFKSVIAKDKEPVYIPVGSAVTSYARNFTIRAAQQNYYGKNKRGFIYADTDSIHCDLTAEELKGITVHPTAFCCWKLESSWDIGLFVRQKTYIEHVTHKDLEPIDKPYYNVKCAGMPPRCKDLFMYSVSDLTEEEKEDIIKKNKYSEEAVEFLKTKRKLTDFKQGLKVPCKLMPKRILGGTLLVETTYEMR